MPMDQLPPKAPPTAASAEDVREALVPVQMRVRGDQIVGLVDHMGNELGMPLTAIKSDGVVVVAGGKTINLLGTSSPAILYDDDVVFTATELIRAAGGYVKQIRCISGTATLDLYDSVDWTGRKLYTGTVSAGDVIDVNAIALNGVSAKVVGTVSISISHTESI